MRGILFDDYEVEIDARSPEVGGSWRVDLSTAWDPDLLRFFNEQLERHEAPYFLDVGASTGSFCLLAVFHEGSRCTAFEPCTVARDILRVNLALNDLVGTFGLSSFGLSERNAETTLYLPPGDQLGLTCLSPTPTRFKPVATEVVRVVTLDHWAKRLDHWRPGWTLELMKIDTEGHELMVLRGGAETIQRHKPDILLEYDERNVAQFGYEREEIVELLKTYGYRNFERLGPDGRDMWATT